MVNIGYYTNVLTNEFINNPHRINLASPRPQLRLFSLPRIHIFATESVVRADLFSEDGLYDVKPLVRYRNAIKL